MSLQAKLLWCLALAPFPLLSPAEPVFDAAKVFGARESVSDLSLSPDGMSVAYVAPTTGQGSALYVYSLVKGAPRSSRPVTTASGKPERLGGCHWVSNQRLVCIVYGVVFASGVLEPVQFTRQIAVNTDGTNLKMLSTRFPDCKPGNRRRTACARGVACAERSEDQGTGAAVPRRNGPHCAYSAIAGNG
jgi:hypothetical protein